MTTKKSSPRQNKPVSIRIHILHSKAEYTAGFSEYMGEVNTLILVF